MHIVFCGDVTPTAVTVPMFEAQNCRMLMGTTLSYLKAADYTVGNLECALTERDTPIRKIGPNLKGKPSYAGTLSLCGFTHLGLSNNHAWDFGPEAMKDTVNAVESCGMKCFGFGENSQLSRKPLILEKDGCRVAVLAVCEHEYCCALPDQMGANPFDPFETMDDIAKAKSQADYVVVMYHGGKELCEYPSPRLRKACQAMVRMGADLVLCQHSHCIGTYENYQNSQIIYGQGNFNFVGYEGHKHTGLLLNVNFDNGMKTEWLPVIETETGITLAEGAVKDDILASFADRSRRLLDDGAWMHEWEAFCASVPSYYDYVRNAYVNVPEGEKYNQAFASYIQCEAHLDVLMTLFKNWHDEKRDVR